MVITELYIRNFGKLSEKHFYLKDGVQVIRGDNEFGKTTLHAFIRAMLFGMERGRGRAAARDAFSRYEPWDNPGIYAGVMRFTCGGRSFRLERNFARQTKYTSLICEDDGEELSVEHGDLEMLLGGMTGELFDNTVSIGQLKAQPGQKLADALANYAANYYTTGGGEYDLSGALQYLDDKRRAAQRELREEEKTSESERQKLWQECCWLEDELNRLEREYKEKEHTGNAGGDPQGPSARKGTALFRGGIGLTAAGLLAAGAGIAAAGNGGLTAMMLCMAAAVVLAAAGIAMLKAGSRTRKTGEEDSRKLEWELEHIRSEQREKGIRYENVRDQYEESGKNERQIRLEEKCRALEMAASELGKAAQVTGDSMERRVSRRASELLSAVTDDRYRSLETDGQGDITVWDGIRKIPAGRLSRGTVEQIYFSIRMAASEILSEEPVPVILDDVFAFYDDKRLESVLKWLSRQEKQVIILSCHRREGEILQSIQGASRSGDRPDET